MADGSVTIGVVLDTAAFAASAAALQGQIGSMAANINQSLTGAFSGADIDSSLTAAVANLAAGITGASAEAVQAMSALAASSSAAFAEGGWSEAGTASANQIASGVYAGAGAVVSAVQSIAWTATEAFDSGAWSSVGQNLMSGIASGIYAAGTEVITAIRSVSAETEAAVKEYYAIRSPSALMRDEVGVMISRGIAEGILSGADFVSGAMESVGRGADRVRMTERTSGGGSVTQNIYLRDSDASPYRTARRIRRESEAIFRN